MNNYDLAPTEVVLLDYNVKINDINDSLHLILTSEKMIFEKEETKNIKIGLFKQESTVEKIVVDTIMLENIKIYNGKVQVKQKGLKVDIQTTKENFTINFDSAINAMKFTTKIIDTLTGTTMSDRGTQKVKSAIDKVDDVLGFSTRDTIKGVIENGITGSIIGGIKKHKK